MLEMILLAIGVGILLSLILIGPVFFLLIETSITKGWRAAIVLDLGVILADILCIVVAYFGSRDLINFIDTHPFVYRMGGFFIFIYGMVMFFTKPQLHWNQNEYVSPSYFKTFSNGFLLNLLNIGVVVFWFSVVSSITLQYPNLRDFLIYMSVVIGTFFVIDLVKIFLAGKFQKKFTDKRAYQMRRILGVILLIFGVIVFLKGYGVFDEIDEKIHDKITHIQ